MSENARHVRFVVSLKKKNENGCCVWRFKRGENEFQRRAAVVYTNLRAHETDIDLVCRIRLER